MDSFLNSLQLKLLLNEAGRRTVAEWMAWRVGRVI